MASPKALEARKLGPQELERAIQEAHRQLLLLRFQLATRQLTNHRQVRHGRRQLARLKTIQRERALGLAPVAAAPEGVSPAAPRKGRASSAAKAQGE